MRYVFSCLENANFSRFTSLRSSAAISWVLGQYSDVLRTTVFPAAIAGMTEYRTRGIGAFQGQAAKLLTVVSIAYLSKGVSIQTYITPMGSF